MNIGGTNTLACICKIDRDSADLKIYPLPHMWVTFCWNTKHFFFEPIRNSKYKVQIVLSDLETEGISGLLSFLRYVVKDLVPDMTLFYEQYRSIEPWLQKKNQGEYGDKQNLQSIKVRIPKG